MSSCLAPAAPAEQQTAAMEGQYQQAPCSSSSSLQGGGAAPCTVPGVPCVPLAARTGRHMQRYHEGKRLCAGCVAVRPAPGGSEGDMQILLVSSRGGKGYGLPKGGWEEDESMEDAARRETVEEAGVRGILEEPVLGQFEFRSGKPGLPDGEGHCQAYVFVMHVAEELECWPEGSERHRTWFSVPDAIQHCRHDWMRDAIHAWLKRRSSNGASPPNAGGGDGSDASAP